MKNELSVWTFPYRKGYYLTHPWKWFNNLYWNIRNFWHRGRYGFAYVDAWNWFDWWPKAGAAALEYIAEYGHGYPGCEPWETPEKWHDYLLLTAEKLRKCAKNCDFDTVFGDEKNEYGKAMDEIMKIVEHSRTENEDGSVSTSIKFTPEQEEIRKKYWARAEEIQKENDEYAAEVFDEIGRNLGRFWD